ncbi:MAG: hypothetical protein ACK53Y_00360, partial [bacterium]
MAVRHADIGNIQRDVRLLHMTNNATMRLSVYTLLDTNLVVQTHFTEADRKPIVGENPQLTLGPPPPATEPIAAKALNSPEVVVDEGTREAPEDRGEKIPQSSSSST